MRCTVLCIGRRTKKITGGFKKLMWYGIMKEICCKATSSCPSVAVRRRNGFHAQTTWRQKARIEGPVGLHHRVHVEVRRS